MPTMPATSDAVPGRYTFDNATTDARDQVRLLAGILDDHSTDVLTEVGVDEGWRCLDLGAGAGTITTWLAEQVGPTGQVVAWDTDPRHIPAHPVVEVHTADVTTADLGDRHYDLIHARLLLMHLPQREQILRRAVAALTPGGALVCSDWDCTSLDEMILRAPHADIEPVFTAFQHALVDLGVSNGMSAGWARRRLPVAMHDAGLTDVETRLHTQVWAGGQAGCQLHASNSRQLETALVDRGLSGQDLTVLRQAMADPHTLAWSYPLITAVGWRPEH